VEELKVPVKPLVTALTLGLLAATGSPLAFANTPSAAVSGHSLRIPAIPAEGVEADDIQAVEAIKLLLTGTGLAVISDASVDAIRVNLAEGPDTIDRIIARIAERAGIRIEPIVNGIRLTLAPPAVASYDTRPCVAAHQHDVKAGTTILFGVPKDASGKQLPGATCVATQTILKHELRLLARTPDPTRLLTTIDEQPEIVLDGARIAAGPIRRTEATWTLIRKSAAPAENESWYQGCERHTPLAVHELWRRDDGVEVKIAGPILPRGTVQRSCPEASIKSTVPETRDRLETSSYCDAASNRMIRYNRSIVENRDVQVLTNGEKRPGRWQTVTTLEAREPLPDQPCASSTPLLANQNG
jgi:hypothetical protein